MWDHPARAGLAQPRTYGPVKPLKDKICAGVAAKLRIKYKNRGFILKKMLTILFFTVQHDRA
jgi:hypothetical protein